MYDALGITSKTSTRSGWIRPDHDLRQGDHPRARVGAASTARPRSGSALAARDRDGRVYLSATRFTKASSRKLPVPRHPQRRPQRHPPSRTSPRAAGEPGLCGMAGARRLAGCQHPGPAGRGERAQARPPLHVRLRRHPWQRDQVHRAVDRATTNLPRQGRSLPLWGASGWPSRAISACPR